MRRLVGAGLVGLLLVSCSSGPRGPFDGFRELEQSEVVKYRIKNSQTRRAIGLGVRNELPSRVQLDIEEEPTGEDAYDIIVRAGSGKGEESQRLAAERLKGRRLTIDLGDGKVIGDAQAFSGTQDIAAADIAMLYVLFAPVLPSPHVGEGDDWRTSTTPIDMPWSDAPLRFTVDHEVAGLGALRGLDTANVKSVALGNVRFKLPLVVPREQGGNVSGSDDLIVNQLFEQLFSDIDNPVEGLAATIAAIPLAIAAPFLAFGEALGSMFGSSSSSSDEPTAPVVDMSGPIELESDTKVWTADGRVLDADGTGTMKLTGQIPELSGQAAELSGKTISLDVGWHYTRRLTSPWPQPRDPPGRGVLPIIAIVLVIVAFVAAFLRFPPGRNRRGRRRDTLPAPDPAPRVHA